MNPDGEDKPPVPGALPLADRLAAVSASCSGLLMRPRVRLALLGCGLLLTGGLLMANSVWTLPLVIVGVLMVVVAWVGHRLEGRFAVDWGQSGTELAFRATIKAAQAPARVALAAPPNEHEPENRHGHEDVIEGEAHTVEIDVRELKALIAAHEAASAETGTATATASAPAPAAPDEIRIRRAAADAVSLADPAA